MPDKQTIGTAQSPRPALLLRPIKLEPFLPSAEPKATPPREVVANVLLLLPFGLCLGLLSPRWHWWKVMGVFAGASLILEITQHLLSIGSFDFTEGIVDTAGGLSALGRLALARRRLKAKTTAVALRICLIGAILSLIAVAIFLASPLCYESPRDVVANRSGTSQKP